MGGARVTVRVTVRFKFRIKVRITCVEPTTAWQSRTHEFGNGVAGEIFRPMHRQDVSNVPTNIIKEKSKLTKPRAEKNESHKNINLIKASTKSLFTDSSIKHSK